MTQATSKSPAKFGRKTLWLLPVVALAIFAATPSCSSTTQNRNPIGERLPSVSGTSLDGETISLPLTEPTIMLVGYVQDAQFDADRWLVGLLQVEPNVKILEVPTISGLFPRMLANTIDGGMRNGIPSEDWQSVVTLYGEEADKLIEVTGNEKSRNMRVVFVDGEGQIRWFHDRGFSASKLLELVKCTETVTAGS